MTMSRRLNAFAAAPGLMQQWLDFGQAIHRSGLEDNLMELVKIRASQVNGCAIKRPTENYYERPKHRLTDYLHCQRVAGSEPGCAISGGAACARTS